MTLTASTAAVAAGVVVLNPAPSQATTMAQVKAELQNLQNQSDQATQQYDQAETQVATLEQQVNNLQTEATTAQQSMNKVIASLGPLAAAQYQAGSVSPTLELMLQQSPDQFLQDASAADESNQNTLVELKKLKVDQAEVTSLQGQASERLTQLQAVEKTAAAQLTTIQSTLKQQQDIYNQMSYAAVAALAVNGVTPQQLQNLPTPVGRIATVIAFEKSQLGMPYQYGGNGPRYDCSGLVKAAYASAGISVPRSTYEYEDTGFGTRIPADLSQMIPGDLIFYNNWDHVATYVGNGVALQDPTTGQVVDYAPWNMMSISAVIRVIPEDS